MNDMLPVLIARLATIVYFAVTAVLAVLLLAGGVGGWVAGVRRWVKRGRLAKRRAVHRKKSE